jgi:hypothetical protein
MYLIPRRLFLERGVIFEPLRTKLLFVSNECNIKCLFTFLQPCIRGDQGLMLWLFKYFLRKIQRKKLAFWTPNKAKLCKILIITLVFEKNANFFAKNCQKSQKIVIITSTPDWTSFRPLGYKRSLHFFDFFFHDNGDSLVLTKCGLGHVVGHIFANSSGHPACPVHLYI